MALLHRTMQYERISDAATVKPLPQASTSCIYPASETSAFTALMLLVERQQGRPTSRNFKGFIANTPAAQAAQWAEKV